MYILQCCVLLTIFSIVTSVPVTPEQQPSIVEYENRNDGSGNYYFSFKTSDGISRSENGLVVNKGEKDEHIVINGHYSYTDTKGEKVLVLYTGDENGYHPGTPQVQPQLPPVQFGLPAGVVASLLGK